MGFTDLVLWFSDKILPRLASLTLRLRSSDQLEFAFPILRLVSSVNFNPRERELIIQKENKLIELGILDESDRTQQIENKLINLTQIN